MRWCLRCIDRTRPTYHVAHWVYFLYCVRRMVNISWFMHTPFWIHARTTASTCLKSSVSSSSIPVAMTLKTSILWDCPRTDKLIRQCDKPFFSTVYYPVVYQELRTVLNLGKIECTKCGEKTKSRSEEEKNEPTENHARFTVLHDKMKISLARERAHWSRQPNTISICQK